MIKSSACGNSNSCVWVGLTDSGLVRVSTVEDLTASGDFLDYTRKEWESFIAGAKAGEFDFGKLTTEPKDGGK